MRPVLSHDLGLELFIEVEVHSSAEQATQATRLPNNVAPPLTRGKQGLGNEYLQLAG